jgi:hypothetical protein
VFVAELSVVQPAQRRIVNNEFERTWKETAMASFEVFDFGLSYTVFRYHSQNLTRDFPECQTGELTSRFLGSVQTAA